MGGGSHPPRRGGREQELQAPSLPLCGSLHDPGARVHALIPYPAILPRRPTRYCRSMACDFRVHERHQGSPPPAPSGSLGRGKPAAPGEGIQAALRSLPRAGTSQLSPTPGHLGSGPQPQQGWDRACSGVSEGPRSSSIGPAPPQREALKRLGDGSAELLCARPPPPPVRTQEQSSPGGPCLVGRLISHSGGGVTFQRPDRTSAPLPSPPPAVSSGCAGAPSPPRLGPGGGARLTPPLNRQETGVPEQRGLMGPSVTSQRMERGPSGS